MNQERRFC